MNRADFIQLLDAEYERLGFATVRSTASCCWAWWKTACRRPFLRTSGRANLRTKGLKLKPTIGRIVIFRSRTGNYDVPAMVVATQETLNPAGVEGGGVYPLSGDRCVHLTVFTPGKPGLRGAADDFETEPVERSENVAGCYQEWDVPQWAEGSAGLAAGTWRWPERVDGPAGLV